MKCHYCGVSADDVELTDDHIVPRSRCGADRRWNIVSACKPCNSAKGSEMPSCDCERCALAVARWQAGMRGVPRADPLRRHRADVRGTARVSLVPPGDELHALSPAMQALLLSRRKKGMN